MFHSELLHFPKCSIQTYYTSQGVLFIAITLPKVFHSELLHFPRCSIHSYYTSQSVPFRTITLPKVFHSDLLHFPRCSIQSYYTSQGVPFRDQGIQLSLVITSTMDCTTKSVPCGSMVFIVLNLRTKNHHSN